MQQLVAAQSSNASKRKRPDNDDGATAGATALKKGRDKGKGGKGGSDAVDDTPWAVRTGDELTIGKGAVTVFLKPTAKVMKVKIDDLCWGMTCTNKTPTPHTYRVEPTQLDGPTDPRLTTTATIRPTAQRPGSRAKTAPGSMRMSSMHRDHDPVTGTVDMSSSRGGTRGTWANQAIAAGRDVVAGRA